MLISDIRNSAMLLLCSSIGVVNLQAQLSGIAGEFELLPQRVYTNPALQPMGKWNIGIPGLSGIYAEHGNNWLRPDRDLGTDASGMLRINPANVLANIDRFAVTTASSNLELFHAGYKFGKHYVHVRAAERMRFSLAVPRDVFVIAAYGNVGHSYFTDNTADFSQLRVNGIHYREYGAGYSIDLGKWQAGATLKYLYGMERVHTAESGLALRTDMETYALQSSGSFMLQTSGIYGAFSDGTPAVHDNFGNYITGLNNHGFAFDAGGVYNAGKKFSVGLSVHDVGFITWKEDVATYGTGDATFAFNGIDLSGFIFENGSAFNDALQEETRRLLDEMEEIYGLERSEEKFTTGIGGLARLGAAYTVLETNKMKGKVWVNGVGGLSDENLPVRISGGYTHQIWKMLEAGLHVSHRNGSGAFIGGGMAVRGGPFQLWCAVENFQVAGLSRVSVQSENGAATTLVYPNRPGDVLVQFGMNLVFMEKEKATRPMVR